MSSTMSRALPTTLPLPTSPENTDAQSHAHMQRERQQRRA